MTRRSDPAAERRWDVLTGLDPLLQHRSRVAAAVLLARHGQLSFSRLRLLLDETDGNLGAQLRKLEDAGYVGIRKEFVDRKPVTWYELTNRGKRALTDHLDSLERLIAAGRKPAAKR
jgi:DNA-binding MarR family transcriptional regulator